MNNHQTNPMDPWDSLDVPIRVGRDGVGQEQNPWDLTVQTAVDPFPQPPPIPLVWKN